MSAPRSELERGYAAAREVARAHARSFFFASHLLFGARRRGAYAIYAFCRRLDDLVDEGPGLALPERLDQARALIGAIFTPEALLPESEPFPRAELAALRDTALRFQLPSRPFLELVEGMAMDVEQVEYRDGATLELYCDRVAGTVGRMLAPLLGARAPEAIGYAGDLGRAMQLTNILRDVREDEGRGRRYLPASDLERFGVDPRRPLAEAPPQRLRAYVRWQTRQTRARYRTALLGVAYLGAFGAQAMVRTMAAIYGGILDVLERRDFDVLRGRAVVSTGRKLFLLGRELLRSLVPSRRLLATPLPDGAPSPTSSQVIP